MCSLPQAPVMLMSGIVHTCSIESTIYTGCEPYMYDSLVHVHVHVHV